MQITVYLETMTGERWSELISAYDEVIVLKKRIFKKKGISPSKQALVFAGSVLPDHQLLNNIGVRNESVIKFVVITRTGPTSASSREEVALSDDPSDWEIMSRRVFSAAEDTSAKESAGETEKEGEEGSIPRKTIRSGECYNRRRTRSQTNTKDFMENTSADLPCSSNSRPVESDDGDLAEGLSDLSEVSSGMIVCDLSNEFRKIKIKKHRHPLPPHVFRQRTRSKTRGEERDVSSSEESEAIHVDPSVLPPSSQIASRRTMQRPSATNRCAKCAFKVTNPFFCRCGKTLCSKHRIHTCGRQRATKLQEVSD